MKKIITLILAVVMLSTCVVAFAACGKGTAIGVQIGTTGQYFVDGDEDWGFDGIKNCYAKTYQNGGLAVTDLKNGVIDYVIIDYAPAKELVKAIEGVKMINISLTEEEYAFGVDKAQPELRSAINALMATPEFTAEFNRIVKAYAEGTGITPVTSATFDANKADKQLVVATNAAFPPFEYKEGDKFAGIDMEIAAYLASKLDLELVIMDMDFDSVVTSVGKNGVDIAMAGLTVNETRKESVDFTNSYYTASQVLIVKEDNNAFDQCKTAEDVIAILESKK